LKIHCPDCVRGLDDPIELPIDLAQELLDTQRRACRLLGLRRFERRSVFFEREVQLEEATD
jgi:hypothetical protein